LAKNAENVSALSEASEVGRAGIHDVDADIKGIARESEGLLEINAVMEHIAGQTNLLSMNAAIEAAHAGEAGKGFAVVAGEIRKLAESSAEQSKTIGTVLKKIHSGVEKITRSTEAVLAKFEMIDRSVKTVSDEERSIRNAMEEQDSGSKQILEAIAALNEISRMVKSSASEMRIGAGEIIREGGNLAAQTAEIENGINEMANGAARINSAANQVNDASIQNRESINVLVREVKRFKL
jgi:methyl-accepting chemotaxis protein